jgi:hypothetical protein
MGTVSFRLRFGDRPATREELDRIEEIVVEQEMDMAWEARIRLFLCVDGNGRWRHGPNEFAEPFSRVRVELDAGDGAFVPLIDGPVAAFDTAMDSQPGRSSVTLVVRDDSVLMNREEDEERFENRGEDEIAREIFGRFRELGGAPRVESPGGAQRTIVRRGTAIQFLRRLARPHGFHAYVLPGEVPGQSVGCFLPDPAGPPELPALTLLGDGRNLSDVQVRENSESPERTRVRTLRLSDQETVSAETSVRDLALMRRVPAVPEDRVATRQAAPEDVDREDAESLSRGRARSASYAVRLSAKVVPGCYRTALAPYRKVSVRAGDTPLSGDFLLTKVVHRITPSVYTQEFEAKGDSRSDPQAPPAGAQGLSVNLSASLSIF